MNAKQSLKPGSSIGQQLNSVNMSVEKRNAALRDALVAELIVDAIGWVCKQASRLGQAGFAKPSPKY